MSIALKELLRQPGRFGPVAVALTLLVLLLTVLGGFLDGLELVQTGAYRAHEGTVIVFDPDAERQLQRSSVSAEAADALRETEGVEAVGTLTQIATTAGEVGGDPQTNADDVLDIVLFGYEVGTDTIPAPDGDGAVVDAQLADQLGLEAGDALAIGPTAVEVPIAAVVDDLTQGSPTVWLDAAGWRELAGAAAPTALPPEGTSQALVVITDRAPDDLAAAVDGIDPVTPAEAIEALDVVQQQSSTFEGIIGVTFAVTLLVVALFFALITLEREGLYAVLKALGARSSDVLLGLSAQAVVISAVAVTVGIALSIGFTALLPPELPIRLLGSRLAAIAVGTVLTALIGSAFTLRRILRIDPAEAIG